MNTLDVDPKILRAFRKARITSFRCILESSVADLTRTTKLSFQDVNKVMKAVSENVSHPTAITALDMYRNNCDETVILRKLSLGCPILDRHLNGGILSQGITEISGESASGKTQVCLQLCLTVQLPYELGGLQGAAIYISTEDVFPSKRLQQIIPAFQQKHSAVLKDPRLGDNIYIEHAADVDALVNIIQQKLPALLKKTNIKLIVIDSIAALFRVEYSMHEMASRSRVLCTVGAQLKEVSFKNNIPVVCVNQVSAVINRSEVHSEDNLTPCLGLTWANQVTVRIMLSRTLCCSTETTELSEQVKPALRGLKVVFAPHLPNVTCSFVVDAAGVHGADL